MMAIKIKYDDLGTEKGFTTVVNGREEFLKRLRELGINVETVHKLEIREKGSDEYKEYDPDNLKG